MVLGLYKVEELFAQLNGGPGVASIGMPSGQVTHRQAVLSGVPHPL